MRKKQKLKSKLEDTANSPAVWCKKQTNCGFCGKSMKLGTKVAFFELNKPGYGPTQNNSYSKNLDIQRKEDDVYVYY